MLIWLANDSLGCQIMKNNNGSNPFKWKHYEGEIILWMVRWYCRMENDHKFIKSKSIFLRRIGLR